MTDARRVDVSVILVGLNSAEFIRKCLESHATARWNGLSYEIIYVDNGSRDPTLQMLADQFPSVRVIANARNLGYCKAANQGAQIAAGRYLFFLNDDTILLEDAVPRLVAFLEIEPRAGVVASRLIYPDGSEQWSGRRFPSMLNALFGRRSILTRLFPRSPVAAQYLCKDQLASGVPFEVDWVSAAAMLVRREVYEQVGGLAEDYYYWHEAVFCDRVAKAGFKVYLHPQSTIIHYEGFGSGPRPHPVRKFHIVDFHRGAFRCYCQRYGLGLFHPLRWFAAAALGGRAAVLLAASWIRSLRERNRT